MQLTSAMNAQVARMSYTDIFALALRRGVNRGAAPFAPSQARQSCFGRENAYPSGKNILYFHVPFCISRCQYCPYYLHPHSPELMRAYLDALTREVALIAPTPYIQSTRFWCVYVGGGTPSLLTPAELERLTALFRGNFRLTDDVEITFEANPSTLPAEKIKCLRELGFNRVSLGVQSFQDPTLRKLRCSHSAALARTAIRTVLEQGLMLNVDLLFGWEGQTQADLEWDLEQLCAAGRPQQASLFPLRIAKGTPLREALQQQAALDLPGHLRRLLQLDGLVEQRLGEHGYHRAETPISYYQKDARPHRYQSVEGRIVGLGAGAGSVLDGSESLNHRDVIRYIQELRADRLPVMLDSPFTREQVRERYILFQILFMNRSLAGFRALVAEHFEAYFHEPIGSGYERVVRDLQRRAQVEVVGGKLVLTDRFWSLLAGLEIGTPSIL